MLPSGILENLQGNDPAPALDDAMPIHDILNEKQPG